MTKTSREILISLSLANLLFLASWRELLYPATYDYHIKFGANTQDFLSVILCVVLTAALLFGSFRLVRHFFAERFTPVINLIFVVSILIAINIFRVQFLSNSSSFIIGIIFQLLVIAALAATLTKWRNSLFNFSKTLVLMFAPFVLITFSQAFWGIMNPPSVVTDEIPVSAQIANVKPSPDKKVKNRVVWIIFDELDYRVPFEIKPIELPEFERLKSESLSATNAQSPAWATVDSVASLLTGKKVVKSEPLGKAELILEFSDQKFGKFSQEGNVLFDVKQLNGNVSVLGWYHPYCRVFGKILSVCKWEGEKFSRNLSLPETMREKFEELAKQIPSAFRFDALPATNPLTNENKHVFREADFEPAAIAAAHRQRLAEVTQIAADPNTDLVFFHLPLPHAPVQYNRFTKEFTAERQDYINNLALTDIVLGEIRKSMEEANLWDDSTVIVSSDHQWRVNTWKEQTKAAKLALTDNDLELTQGVEDPRIPFFVKLKNQKESIVYDKRMNTLISRELILAIMKGEISSPADLKNRLDAAN